jgi:putative peptidyl-prolyl cis-trans isomerase
MKTLFYYVLIISFPLSLFGAEQTAAVKAEIIDKVAAVINGKPVTESEVNFRLELLKKSRNQLKNLNKNTVLDQLIDERLIEQVAEDEAIQVTELRIDNEIADMMKRAKISDKASFIKKIQAEQGITYEMLRLQIRQQSLTDQVMTYAISYAPPSKREIREWYEKNKNRPEFIQMNMKHILIRSRSSSLNDEKAANEKIKSILKKVQNGASFDETARQESQDPGSAVKGGELGWTLLTDLDPYFANAVLQQYKAGSVSGIIKSSFGYHIVKFFGKRVIPYEEMEPRIAGMLSFQKRSEQFTKWLINKRREAELAIYMEGYTLPKGANEKGAGSTR